MTVYEQVRALVPKPGFGRRAPAPYGVIEVSGPDAVQFLHRLCSQDIEGLAAGRCAPAAFLTAKGKLVATAVVARAGERVVVETQDSSLGPVHDLLERYHFTERLQIRRRDDWTCVELAGVGGADLEGVADRAPGTGELGEDRATFAVARHGVRWVRAHGPESAVGTWASDFAALPADLAECIRILGGAVRVGVDTDEGTLALEADLDDHVSTTKGCYVGQEIVARIHTYGHVNRRIALLQLDTPEPIARATPLCDASDGEPVGRVMSAVRIPTTGVSIGLGYLPDAFVEEPEPLQLGAAGGPAVQLLPFSPA